MIHNVILYCPAESHMTLGLTMNEVTGILEIEDDGMGISFDDCENSFIDFINCIVLPMPAVAILIYL